jgi:hypothetical protein
MLDLRLEFVLIELKPPSLTFSLWNCPSLVSMALTCFHCTCGTDATVLVKLIEPGLHQGLQCFRHALWHWLIAEGARLEVLYSHRYAGTRRAAEERSGRACFTFYFLMVLTQIDCSLSVLVAGPSLLALLDSLADSVGELRCSLHMAPSPWCRVCRSASCLAQPYHFVSQC